MKRYNLQDGDGVHVAPGPDLMLVMNGGRLSLTSFDASTVELLFHWTDSEPVPVRHDAGGFYIEVDDSTWFALMGLEVLAWPEPVQSAAAR